MYLLVTLMLLSNILFFLLIFRDKNDIFSPINVVPVIFFIKVIPSMLYISLVGVPDSINKNLVIEAITSADSFVKYVLFQLLYFTTLMLIIVQFTKKSKKTIQLNYRDEKAESHLTKVIMKKKSIVRWGWLFLVLGGISLILMFRNIGGVWYFINNLHMRTIILRDQDLLSWTSSLIIYSPILFIYSKKYDSDKRISFLFLIFILVIGIASGLGGRKNILLLFLKVIVIYNYSVSAIELRNLFKFKNIIIIMVIMFLFGLLPMLRTPNNLDYIFWDLNGAINDVVSNAVNLIVNESYVPFYITVVHYFDFTNFWFGRSYLGLITAFIPSSLYSLKPPVDDGMYLYSIALGRNDVSPVMATQNLNVSSYPLETFGSMYANFGFIGLLFGGVIMAIIISKAYNFMKKSNYNLFSLLLYSNIIFNFELSTLRIVQLLTSIVISYFISLTSEKVKL